MTESMYEKYGDGYEVVARIPAHLPGKIIGTARLFLKFYGRESLSTVIKGTIHEFRHMASDPGGGTIEILTHPVTGEFLKVFYRPEGNRSPEQRIIIALAVGSDNMSDGDRQMLLQAFREIKTRDPTA